MTTYEQLEKSEISLSHAINPNHALHTVDSIYTDEISKASGSSYVPVADLSSGYPDRESRNFDPRWKFLSHFTAEH